MRPETKELCRFFSRKGNCTIKPTGRGMGLKPCTGLCADALSIEDEYSVSPLTEAPAFVYGRVMTQNNNRRR